MKGTISPAEFPIGVVGSGVMGRGIAQIAAAAGFPVRLFDAQAQAMAEACEFVRKMLARAAEKGQMRQDEAAAAGGRVQPVASLHDLAPCGLVVEAIVEQLEPKQTLFKQLEDIVRDDAILATNTSSLSVTAIAAGCKRPERVAGYHFFNPVPLMKLVEVVGGVRTTSGVLDVLEDVARLAGHKSVRVEDSPGFLVNHAGRAYTSEALRIVQEGIADYATIDAVMREAAGFRMGPFELLDLTALDVSFPAMNAIYTQYFHEPRYRPTALMQQRTIGGVLGRKVGRGFYEYRDGTIVRPPEPPVPNVRAPAVWIGPGARDVRAIIGDLAGRLDVKLDRSATPDKDSLCIVVPLGDDATTTATALNLDPKRTVAVDTLYGLKGRRTIMTTPVTEAVHRDAAHALFAADGSAVSVIHDSPGFIVPRVVAMIANLGADIAQQRIAAPADIDFGVKLGLGYPDGPLTLGDKIGAARVLTILERLFAFYGDPRYRPSPWLKRRAMLGVSLFTPEA
ncbi:MAG TPA: 3-hydroxyacyl-CoA dehydrogenase [Alphaproteobacteria bacterium]